MPLGLWKSKWEIHREDMERWREEAERRDREWREENQRFRAETREERERSDAHWLGVREECRELRSDYDRELAESRTFNRELLIRLEKTYGDLNATMGYVVDELHELKAAVTAQTQAIMRLVDRFEDTGGRPPV